MGFKILNFATGKPDKVQVRDLVRIVDNVDPIAQRGLRGGGAVRGKIRFIEPQGVNGHRRPVPGAPSSGTPRESLAKQGRDSVGIV